MWSSNSTAVKLDGTGKGKIKEKTDVGMFNPSYVNEIISIIYVIR
jgi:hypothetical protein